MTNLTFRVNNSEVDSAYGETGVIFIDTDLTEDFLIFSEGSDEVKDGEAIPTELDLNRAAVELDPVNPVIVSKYFLADIGSNILKEVKLAGNQNKRYVFCCSFDGATASEPKLEAWDDENLDSYDLACLGEGTPNLSWFRAICTTDSLPGEDWTSFGTPLAGSGASNSLFLNNGAGALTEAKNLYFNFQIVIPGGIDTPAAFSAKLLITYSTN